MSPIKQAPRDMKIPPIYAHLGLLASAAVVSFVVATVLPVVEVPVLFPGIGRASAHVSLWDLLPGTCGTATAFVVATGLFPLVLQRGYGCLFPLIGATALWTLVSVSWMGFATGRDGKATGLLLVLFTASGLFLLAEAFKVRPIR